jgi:glutamate-5-semialdehyde dehydrogenase
MDIHAQLRAQAQAAREASAILRGVSADKKNALLRDWARDIRLQRETLRKANDIDCAAAAAAGMSKAFIDRLTLTDARIEEMAACLESVAELADPVGQEIKAWPRPNGLMIHKVRTPIGVIAIIYESRPNVTSDCAGLCIKAGNAVILRGGSDALSSNTAIHELLRAGLAHQGLPEASVTFIASKDRAAVDELLTLTEHIDLVMPRGGEGLINHVVEHSRIPVIKHYKGVCHVYVDEYADLNMAQKICVNAKVQRPGTCNAMECLLVHQDMAARFLPGVVKELRAHGVTIKGCAMTRRIIKDAEEALDADYYREYLDLVLNIRVVDSLAQAIAHINTYGSDHSDAIVTDNEASARVFTAGVDSACVYVNASTRFTDGYQFGLGAEVGISTDRLHARGPMGLEELTTYKYVVCGTGQVRE